jgi:hypothetical protein
LFGEHATLRGDARGRIPRTPVLLDKQTICEPKAATGIDLHQAAARMLAIVDLTISQDHFTDRMSLR